MHCKAEQSTRTAPRSSQSGAKGRNTGEAVAALKTVSSTAADGARPSLSIASVTASTSSCIGLWAQWRSDCRFELEATQNTFEQQYAREKLGLSVTLVGCHVSSCLEGPLVPMQ